MSLSASLNIARSALSSTAEQTSVVSRNVANVGNPNASRRSASVITTLDGGVRVASITRAADQALHENMQSARSSATGNAAMLAVWNQLDRTINDPELGFSPQAKIGQLAEALQLYSSAPHNPVHATAIVESARDVVQSLNDANDVVSAARANADLDIGNSVVRLNELLQEFHDVNTSVVNATRSNADATDFLDQRDRILGEITKEVGIKTTLRADMDMAIYTDSGMPLFDVIPRSVEFHTSGALASGVNGNTVFVDGLPVTGDASVMQIRSGRVSGLVEARDNIATIYESQLDEIARGLIVTFAESDQSAIPALADAAGLFTYSGGPMVNAAGSIINGLAGDIRLNETVDPRVGGEPSRVRDGGASDPGNAAYIYNTTGAAGFSSRLEELAAKLEGDRVFDTAAQAVSTGSLSEFAAASASWLEAGRQASETTASYQNTLYERSADAFYNATGTNLDEEMTLLLDLERTYQASTRLISTIDEMFDSLLRAT